MSRVVELLYSRRTPQVAVLALMSFGFAGCSADMQTRLSQNSLSNPFSSQPEATGSIAAPAPQVERRELPQYARPQAQYPQSQYQSSALPPPVAAPQSYPAGGVSGGGRGLASYSPPSRQPVETTGSVAPRSIAATRAPGREAGTTIIVGTSDTMETLSRRYNVSSAAIMQANGYKGPRALQPGQQLIIPHQAALAAAPAVTAPPKAAVAAAPAVAAPSVHVVNRGDTLMSIAHRNHVPVAELARANGVDANSKLKLGQKINVPGTKSAAAPAVAQPAPVAAAQPAVVAAPATKLAAVAPDPPRKRPGLPRPPPRRKQPSSKHRSRPRKPPARCRLSAGRSAAGSSPGTAPRPTANPMTALTSRCPRARR